jgi:hypothetical protein
MKEKKFMEIYLNYVNGNFSDFYGQVRKLTKKELLDFIIRYNFNSEYNTEKNFIESQKRMLEKLRQILND